VLYIKPVAPFCTISFVRVKERKHVRSNAIHTPSNCNVTDSHYSWSSDQQSFFAFWNFKLWNYFFLVGWDWLGTAATTGLLYQPQMVDDGDCGAVGGMKIDRGNRSTRRKPASVPLCPPQIPHGLTRVRTRAAAVGSKWLIAWAMARPRFGSNSEVLFSWLKGFLFPLVPPRQILG
jgi:hypothetical protein